MIYLLKFYTFLLIMATGFICAGSSIKLPDVSQYFEHIKNEQNILRQSKNNYVKAVQSYRLEEYADAVTFMIKTIEIQNKHKDLFDPLIRASVYQRMALIYQDMGKIQEAKKYFNQSIDILPQHTQASKRSMTIYYTYANFVYQYLQDNKKAEKYYQYALDLASSIKENTKSVIYTYLNASSFYEEMGMFSKSKEILDKAKKRIEKSKDNNLKATVLLYIADYFLQKNDYVQAHEYINKAKRVSKNIMSPDILMHEAKIFRKLDLYSRAMEIYRKLQERKIKNKYLLFDLYNNMGICSVHLKHYADAEIYYHKALDIALTSYGITPAAVYNNLARLYKLKGTPLKSKTYYKKAIQFWKKKYGDTQYNYRLATVYVNIGSLYDDLKMYDEAEKYYEKALKIRKAVYVTNSMHIADLYSNTAVLRSHEKKYKDAFSYIVKAINIYVNNIQNLFVLLSPNEMSDYIRSNKRFADHLLEYGYMSRKPIDTFNRWLQYKGVLFDQENIISMLYAKTPDASLRKLLEELMASKRILAKLYQSLPPRGKYMERKQQVRALTKKIQNLKHSIAKKSNRFRQQIALKKINYKTLTKFLKKNDLYLDYAYRAGNYYLFAIDYKGNIQFKRIGEQDSDKINKLIKSFRNDIEKILSKKTVLQKNDRDRLGEISKKKLESLYSLLLKDPLGRFLKNKPHLIISPDGALRLLPFEALFDKQLNQYLIEIKDITYIPSGKEFIRLHRNAEKVKKTQNIFVFANPDFDTDLSTNSKKKDGNISQNLRIGIIRSLFKMRFSPLPGTKREAENIQNILIDFPIYSYFKKKANEKNLLRVNHPKILHIATHGFFIDDSTIPNPMLKSGIALSGANSSLIRGKSDGVVTALKLIGLDLRGTELVVLSACQTGVLDMNDTQSLSGLGKAFIQAGAQDVIMSLWSVDDQATQKLMSKFYQKTRMNENYSQALKNAKLEMIDQGMHPFYWAPFVVYGI